MKYYLAHKFLRNTTIIVSKDIEESGKLLVDENGLVLVKEEQAKVLLTNPDFTKVSEILEQPVKEEKPIVVEDEKTEEAKPEVLTEEIKDTKKKGKK